MALKDSLKAFANKISGTSYVDNMQNSNSAAYKTKPISVANQQMNSKQLLPKQQVYGVPGISKNSQLPNKYQ